MRPIAFRNGPVVTLMTDYGTSDHYVGVLKGVILSIAPTTTLVDITHQIEPGGIRQGAFLLRQSWSWFPRGTIHLAVVDPGVGSTRRILLAQYAGQFVIAPDNGLLTFLHRDYPAEALYVVEDRRFFLAEVSATFHGRDIMAPVAAHLANGVRPREFGRVTDGLEILPIAHRARSEGDSLVGEVLYVDRFGTLITNIRADQVSVLRSGMKDISVLVDDLFIGPVRTAYHEVAAGEVLALIGSGGHLEIAVNQGRAVERWAPIEKIRITVR